jgi:type II secretory pathway pseudopilin PulG
MTSMLAKPAKYSGYTLVEILIVVSILVILGLAVLVGINPITQIFKGYDTRRKADLSRIKIALENYYSDHDCYPLFPLKDAENRPSYACDSNFLKPYLAAMPCDPSTKKPYVISLVPTDAICPQQFAVYAQIYSFFEKTFLTNYCNKTITANSPDITQIDLINGCATSPECFIHSACVGGKCVIISQGTIPSCKNPIAQTWCEGDCGGVVDCATAPQCN